MGRMEARRRRRRRRRRRTRRRRRRIESYYVCVQRTRDGYRRRCVCAGVVRAREDGRVLLRRVRGLSAVLWVGVVAALRVLLLRYDSDCKNMVTRYS